MCFDWSICGCLFKSLIICLRMVAGDPDALVKVAGRNDSALEGWAENDHLQLLNLTYVFSIENLPPEICKCKAGYQQSMSRVLATHLVLLEVLPIATHIIIGSIVTFLMCIEPF